MGLIHEEITQKIPVLTGFICNKCKEKFDDPFEVQEMVYYSSTGGYDSIFGDGNSWSLTLCQRCADSVFGMYIEDENEYESEE